MKSKRTGDNTKLVPTQERLQQVLVYDPDTGVFKWLPGSGKNQSRVAGYLYPRTRYRVIHIDGVFIVAHRLAWLWCYNCCPVCDVDHINGDREDNRIANLRLASRSENNANCSVRSHSKSGVKGVRWHRGNGMWQARLTRNGKEVVAYRRSIEEAAEAYKQMAEDAWGDFCYHRRSDAVASQLYRSQHDTA